MKRLLFLSALIVYVFACCPSSTTKPPTPIAETPTAQPSPVPSEPIDTPAPPPAPTETPLPTDTPQPPPTDTPLPPGRVQAQVVNVTDGDTIEVSIEGQTFKLRYIGIDTPEKQVEPFGPKAAAKNEELVGGKVVELEKDVSETDQYGRLLRYVYVGDLMINAELVRLGFAQASAYPPDVKYQDLFLQLQQEAREAGRGLWGAPPEPTSAPAVECPYIGNRNSKKFHHSWCSSVGDMKESNKVCLQSREEAIAGGYVPCKRCNP